MCSEEDVCAAVGEGLSEGEDVAVVITGAVEMTDAVLVIAEPIVVPGGRKGSFKDCEVNKRTFFRLFLPTSETDAGDTSAGERQNWVYSHRSRCATGHKTCCTRCL